MVFCIVTHRAFIPAVASISPFTTMYPFFIVDGALTVHTPFEHFNVSPKVITSESVSLYTETVICGFGCADVKLMERMGFVKDHVVTLETNDGFTDGAI